MSKLRLLINQLPDHAVVAAEADARPDHARHALLDIHLHVLGVERRLRRRALDIGIRARGAVRGRSGLVRRGLLRTGFRRGRIDRPDGDLLGHGGAPHVLFEDAAALLRSQLGIMQLARGKPYSSRTAGHLVFARLIAGHLDPADAETALGDFVLHQDDRLASSRGPRILAPARRESCSRYTWHISLARGRPWP
jgi:hypothetical protein